MVEHRTREERLYDAELAGEPISHVRAHEAEMRLIGISAAIRSHDNRERRRPLLRPSWGG